VPAFVTVSQMETALQRQLEWSAATEALDVACETVRDFLGQRLDAVTGDVVVLSGTGRATLLLPQLPVTGVTSVVETGYDGTLTTLPVTDYLLDTDDGDGILWKLGGGCWPVGIKNVTVTYSHGYPTLDDIPASIRGVTVSVASRVYHQIAATPGVRAEQLGAHSITYDTAVVSSRNPYGVLSGLEASVLATHKVRRIPAA
jgi:hypothetical protein